MTQAALDSPQEAADFDVTGWDFDLNDLVVLFLSGKGLPILVVDVGGDVLSQTVSKFTELPAAAVNFVWVMAVCTLASVHLEVIQCPTLSVGYWA